MNRPAARQTGPRNNRSRGWRRPFRGTGQRGRPPHSGGQNVQQSWNPPQVFDWFHQEYKDENQESDSRSSSPCAGPSQWPHHGRRDGTNHRLRRSSNGSTQSNQDEKPPPRYSKFNQIMRLSLMSRNDIAGELTGNSDFKLLLDSKMNGDFTVITLRILSKLGQSDFKRIVINILSDVCQSEFLETLERYLVKLPSETRANARMNKFYWDDVNSFWHQLLDFFEAVVELVPVDLLNKLLQIIELTQRYVIESVKSKGNHEIDNDIQPHIRKLCEQLGEKQTDESKDFRTLSLVPTVDDLNDYQPYIRPCKTHGAYDSVEHYLDVQFRLLREDFICPLRQGIEEYKKAADANVCLSHISDIRIFHKVKLIGPIVAKDKIGIAVFFGAMRKMNWNLSKLFMYGSLLCLSKDNFKTVLFATVVERDPQRLAKGELIIQPCTHTEITEDMYNSEFVMVESKVYFLPYYHTLRSLRYMSANNFPMKRYVVDAETTPNPPKYLDKSTVYTYKGFDIPVMDEKRWPSAKMLQFDQSQYEAFKCALLQELSVLHGPPGTGKTFIALQIASVLLQNSSSWYKPSKPTPMIVVCLTNHALDQFLEGITVYTESLVRIGEQSKNPNLTKYKLKTVRENYFKDEKQKDKLWRRTLYHRRQLQQVSSQLSRAYTAFRALFSDTSVISPETLGSYCLNDYELQRLTTEDLIARLFGAEYVSVALGLRAAASDSLDLELNDENNSEDENEDEDDKLEIASVISTNEPRSTCLEMDDLNAAIEKSEKEINQSEFENALKENPYPRVLDPVLIKKRGQLKQLKSLRDALQARLSHHPLLANGSVPIKCTTNVHWNVYWHWITSSCEVVKKQISKLEEEYRELFAQLNDFKQMGDLEVMRNCLVVGLTTTGAARLHESLRALQAPIVIVEEAAEILEAHVICSLTEHCQQVILIGDHKQLRPKPATYELEINYNLNISLFERIVNMRDKYTQLVIQHRMRPQIAELISPSIYETLKNYMSVYTYPSVKGVEKNLLFLNHTTHEVGNSENGSMSNPFEVKFLLTFAKYLKQQGYKGHEITILCTYSGQLSKFKQAKKSFPTLNDVRVKTVDNYQGEENRIILLSLVRNNHTGNVGFLKIENRVCVALSRAREGLYIMGNMDNLIQRNQIWPKIKKTLEDNDAIGSSLVLQCQIHTDQLTEIRTAKDFGKASDGGCSRQCDADLPCLHICKQLCHISNRDHKDYVCIEPCLRSCSNGHPCKLLCNAPCKPCEEIITVKLECRHSVRLPCSTNLEKYQCETQVTALLRCGHKVLKPCYKESSTFPCTHTCNKSLLCGHSCKRTCHLNDDASHSEYLCEEDCKKTAVDCSLSHPCPKKCHEPCAVCATKVEKKRSCGHIWKIQCSRDVEKKQCTRLCTRDLPCGHRCKLKCNLPCGPCTAPVVKIIPDCGHEVSMPCSQRPTAAMCTALCSRMLKCGHPCVAQCREVCTEHCEYPRPLPTLSLCQHVFAVPCYKIELGLAEYAHTLLKHCSEACATELPCGHVCTGSCGSCNQGRIHKLCCKPCSRILICGHKCEALCKDPCPPCQKVCSHRCEHDKCEKKCRTPCIPCQKPCSWRCEHLQCTKLCHEMCDREPCDKPCPKTIECGHPCTGFCGDPCPTICRICNAEDLPTFVREENKSNARFVRLPECGHNIESDYLDWEWQRSYRIGIKLCPICKTPITHCTRYTNRIKQERENIKLVGSHVTSIIRSLRADEQTLIDCIHLIDEKFGVHLPGFNAHKKLFESLQTLVNARKILDISQLSDMNTKLTITDMIINKVEQIRSSDRHVDSWPVVLNQIIMMISSLPTDENISYQMIDNVQNEFIRLYYMVELCKLEKTEGFNQAEYALRIEIMNLELLNLEKFTSSNGDLMFEQLSELKKSFKSPDFINKLESIRIRILGLNQDDWFKCPKGHICMMKCRECIELTPSAPLE